MRRPGGNSSSQPVGTGNHQGNRSMEMGSLLTRGGVYDQQPTGTFSQLEEKAYYRQEAQTQHSFGGTCTNSRQGASHLQQNYLGVGSTVPQQQQQFRRGFPAPTELRHSPYLEVPNISSSGQWVPQGQHPQYQQQHGWTAGGRSHGGAFSQGNHMGNYVVPPRYRPSPTLSLPRNGLPPEPPPPGFPLNPNRSQHYASYFCPVPTTPLVPNPPVSHRGPSFPSSHFPVYLPHPAGLPSLAITAGARGNAATGSSAPSQRTPLPSGPIRPQSAPQRGPAPRKPLPSSKKAQQGSRQVHKAVRRAQQAAQKDQRPMRAPPAPTSAPVSQPQPTEPTNPADTDPSHPNHPSHQAYLAHLALRSHEGRQAQQAYQVYQADREGLHAHLPGPPRSRPHLSEPARPEFQLAYRPSWASGLGASLPREAGRPAVEGERGVGDRSLQSGTATGGGGVTMSLVEEDETPRLPNPRFFPEVVHPDPLGPEGGSNSGPTTSGPGSGAAADPRPGPEVDLDLESVGRVKTERQG